MNEEEKKKQIQQYVDKRLLAIAEFAINAILDLEDAIYTRINVDFEATVKDGRKFTITLPLPEEELEG
jgi:hypothetical protein